MRASIANVCAYGLGLAIMVGLFGVHLGAAAPAAPEVDASYVSAGLGGLAAAVLILRSRRRTK